MAVVVPNGTKPGTKGWLEATAKLAKSWSDRSEKDVRTLVGFLTDLRKHDWRSLVGGSDDWDRLCKEVINHDPSFLREMERGVEALDRRGHKGPITEREARKAATETAKEQAKTVRPGRREKSNSYNITNCNDDRGTSQPYLLRRLARMDNDGGSQWLNRYESGEFPSVRAAAIEAGIVKVPTNLEKAQKAFLKLTDGEREAFAEWIDLQGS